MLGVCPFGLLVVPPIQPVRVRLGPRRKDIKPAGQMADDDQAGDILFSRHHQQKNSGPWYIPVFVLFKTQNVGRGWLEGGTD